mmetsp:Transcript_141803/g.453032  ORF Transcript_141803/g.453032 Transcript_141803/m.453032 type:complete len:261 (-) Transcript_141803:133-915(-)
MSGYSLEDLAAESHWEKAVAVALGGACASTAYFTFCRLLQGDGSTAEGVVDLLHSAYTSAVAARGISALQRHEVFDIALPPKLARAGGPVVRMFCHSMGYFLADACLILLELSRGHSPKLWAGRLVHHAIQSTSNGLSIFRTSRPQETLAMRSGLCQAYFAEFSTIFLRLSSLARRSRSVQHRWTRALDWSLLVSFGLCRLVNFSFLIRCCLRARPVFSPGLHALLLGIQGSAYVLNVGWFLKLARSCLRPSMRHVSLEC